LSRLTLGRNRARPVRTMSASGTRYTPNWVRVRARVRVRYRVRVRVTPDAGKELGSNMCINILVFVSPGATHPEDERVR
jgi:hypothetical protein